MNVVHVIAPGGVGGAETVVAGAAAALRGAGADASILAIRETRCPDRVDALVASAEARDVPIRLVESRGRLDRRLACGIADALSETGADVVHAHGYKATIYSAMGGQGERRMFATQHGTGGGDRKAAMYDAMASATYRRVRRVFAVSEDTRRFLIRRGVPPRKVVTLHNFADLHRVACVPAPATPSEARFIFVGRLSYEKGVDVLLQALAWTSNADITLELIGDGPEHSRLEKRASELGLGDRVSFAGFVDDVASRYAGAHAVVLPSRTEGLPMTMVEAMAAGRPVVATRVGGIPEAFDPALGGELVASEDAGALAAALDRVAAERAERVSRAIAGADAVRDAFSPERWAARTLDEYAARV